MQAKHQRPIEKYYGRRESRWGYKYILGGNKHYGYFPKGKNLSLKKALELMSDQVGSELGLKEDSKVLDAGCGEGPVAFRLAQKFGYKVTAIDLLKINIVIANRKKQQQFLDNPTFEVGDFSEMKFADNSFDGVVILEALVHSPDYSKTLKEVFRVLKPGGIFVTHNYIMPDKMNEHDERVFEVVYNGSGMNTLDQFRTSKMNNIWEEAGFKKISDKNGIEEITPMMRKLYHLALVPYHIARLMGKHESYTNMYAGYWMYKLRHLICYQMLVLSKPK